MSNRPVVRRLWRSTDNGRTWEQVDVRAGSPLSVQHIRPGGTITDGYNIYREDPPEDQT